MTIDKMDPAAVTAAIRFRIEQFLMQDHRTDELRQMARFLEYATEHGEYLERDEEPPFGVCDQFEDAFAAALGWSAKDGEDRDRKRLATWIPYTDIEKIKATIELWQRWGEVQPLLTAALQCKDGDALKLAIAALTTEKAA